MRDDMWMKSAGEKIARELGAEISAFLNDESITEIMLNQDGTVWIDRMGEGMSRTGIVMARERAMLVIGSVAAYKHTTVNEKKPLLSANLPGGQRFQAMIEPVTTAPVFSIRCGRKVMLDLLDYIPERMTERIYRLLQKAISERRNIIVSGGTGSGKTTLSSALLAEIGRLCPDDRIAVMEDTPELQIVNRNAVFERITDNACASALLAANLRMRPDRIILGETRGAEAMELLKAWNTGHPGGICTIHANSATSALSRLETLILESNISGMTLPFIRSLIADAVNLVVHVQKDRRIGPVVSEVLEVSGLDIDGAYRTSVVEKRKD